MIIILERGFQGVQLAFVSYQPITEFLPVKTVLLSNGVHVGVVITITLP